jgi:hypothetical protein
MTTEEAKRHLRARLHVQKTLKTSYNRLRWNGSDIAAVEILLSELAISGRRTSRGTVHERTHTNVITDEFDSLPGPVSTRNEGEA